MNSNVNLEAAFGVLLFLGTCLALAALALFVAHGLVARKYGRMLKGSLALFVLLAVYLGLMLVFSLRSEERALARGAEKYFCEIDCHLAYSVVDLKQAKSIGNPPGQATAAGMFYIITVRTRFDENTISSGRGDAPLTPNPRVLTVFDGDRQKYNLSTEGQRALELSGGGGTPIMTPLRPGETYTTALVFDLPATVSNPSLLINEEWLPTRFIVGHENSFWHGQTRFRLDAQEQQTAGSPNARAFNP
ncbi:MAG TPA: hypothetical protein VGC89_09940 [Pyrinomonadaceae bacterium]